MFLDIYNSYSSMSMKLKKQNNNTPFQNLEKTSYPNNLSKIFNAYLESVRGFFVFNFLCLT